MSVLRGRAVLLRPAADADVTDLVRIRSTPEVRRRWRGGDDVAATVASDLVDDEITGRVVELDGRVAGWIQWDEESDPDYRRASIDLYLDPAVHGRGVGTDAVRTAAAHLIDDLGHHRIVIDPAADNAAAIRCYAKVGFRPVGVMRRYERDEDGTWHDGLLMDLLADELLRHDVVALGPDALPRLAEIDRSEEVRTGYRQRGAELVAEPVEWHVPDWAHEGDGPHSVGELMRTWQPVVDAGGSLLGVIGTDGRLAGLTLVRHDLRPGLAQLALLFVSRSHRRAKVAGALMAAAEEVARSHEATAMYVSATPSASAVGFYLRHGFRPTDTPLPELLAAEPEDIHMVKSL